MLPNNHFKKTAKRIKVNFDQPANKLRRRNNRALKAKRMSPMPTEKLRPIVRCPTIRYNRKERLGRGFTPEECREAGIEYLYARTIGIAVDTKRRNMNKEAFDQNVERLKTYLSKIKVFDTLKEAKASGVSQHRGIIMPLEKKSKRVEMISANEVKNYQ